MVTVTRDPDRHRVSLGEGYDGVVQVVAGSVYGSGVLLHGGRAVLTAAHVLEGADAVTVRLDTPVGRVNLPASHHALHPGYDAVNANSDLALVWLAAPAPASAQRTTLYREADELGQAISLVGYGLPGDGLTGHVDEGSAEPAKRHAENRVDTTGKALKAALGRGIAWDPQPGSQLIVDFDDGSDTHDALGVLLGVHDTGLGEREGLIAPGDTLASAKALRDLGLVLDGADGVLEAADHVHGAVLVGEDHRLLGRQAKTARVRVVGEVARGGVVGQPLAQVALRAAAARRELLGGGRAVLPERAIKPQPITQLDQGDAVGAAEIADDPAHELVQRVLVDGVAACLSACH